MYKLILILFSLMLVSCNATKNTTATGVDYRSDLDGEWILVQLNDRAMDVSMTRPTVTISQSNQRVSGNGSCNNFATTLEKIGPTSIDLGEISSTKMACPSISLETEYFKALSEAKTYRIKGATLTLMNKGEKVVLSYSKG